MADTQKQSFWQECHEIRKSVEIVVPLGGSHDNSTRYKIDILKSASNRFSARIYIEKLVKGLPIPQGTRLHSDARLWLLHAAPLIDRSTEDAALEAAFNALQERCVA